MNQYHHQSHPKLLPPCLTCLLVFLLAATSIAGTLDQRLVRGLCERGLYRLADVHCKSRLDSDHLSNRERAEMTIEWSLVAVSRAFDASAHLRDPHWNQAHARLDGFSQPGDGAPFQLLVDLQDALTLLQRAELERLENLDARATADDVKNLLRLGIAGLRDAAAEVEQRRQQAALGQSRGAPEFTPAELDGLDRNIAIALARTYREQGLTYPPDSTDRINALQQAAESLGRLASGSPADEVAWRARILLAESLGELGRTEEGLVLATKWSDEKPEANVAAQLLAVRLRLLTGAGRRNDAQGLLQSAAPPAGESPEFDLAHLHWLLASKKRDAVAVDGLLASIRASHGPRWIRRAEAIVGRTFAEEGDQATATGQTHAAEHFFRAGKFDEAVAAFDRAAELHRQAANRTAAFDAERAAAAIVQQQQDYPQAAERFRRLALGSLDRDDSASDHREAILCLAAAARASEGEPQQQFLDAYVNACREHLRHWKSSPTTEEVRYWLGQSLASRQQWLEAVEVLDKATPDSPRFDSAMTLLAVAYRSHLRAITDAAKQRAWLVRARERLQPTITGPDNRWPASWSDSQRACALELARMHLTSGRTGATYAEEILGRALLDSPQAGAWRAEAVPLLALALVESGKTTEAIDLLRDESTEGVTKSLEPLVAKLASGLADLEGRDQQRAAAGKLILAAIEIAGEDAIDWRAPADRYRAAALAAVGNELAARKLYESLIAQFPRDGDLQEEYARLLATTGDHDQGLTAWTRVESASQRGGERWHRARAARTELLKKLGRQDEARKLEQLTRILYPGERGP